MYAHTHTSVCEKKCSDHKDLKDRSGSPVISYHSLKVPKQYRNLRINQLTAEENLKMLEMRDTHGNVNTLILKSTLIVYRAQCAVRSFLWQRKKFKKLKLRLRGRTKIKCCLWHVAWCVRASHQANDPERGWFCSFTFLQAAVPSLWPGKTSWSMRQPRGDRERQHQQAGLQPAGRMAGAGKAKWVEKSCCMGRN